VHLKAFIVMTTIIASFWGLPYVWTAIMRFQRVIFPGPPPPSPAEAARALAHFRQRICDFHQPRQDAAHLAGPHSRHNGGPGNALLVITNTVDYFLRLMDLKPLDHEHNHMMALAQAKSKRAMVDLQDAITVRREGGDDWMGPAQKGGAAMRTLYARAKDALRRAAGADPSDDVLWEEAHRL